MNAETPGRGTHLVAGGRTFVAAGGWLARMFAGSFAKVVERIDRGLAEGSLLARLPDGSMRMLGGRADGPAAEIDLRDWRAIVRLATGGSAGWYQAWDAGEWDSPDPVQIFALFMRNATHLGNVARPKGPWRWAGRALNIVRRNTRKRAKLNISAHYDLGNDFYAAWLDPTMSYSSALWQGLVGDAPLVEAQRQKVDALAARLLLKPDDDVLEVGCGWGYLARRLAKQHHVRVTGISISDEQLDWARAALTTDPVPGVTYLHEDYRDVAGQFDAVVSVEMVEAVGREFWPAYFDSLARVLKPGGRAALQYISIRDEIFDVYAASADFIQTYIFPGGLLVRDSEFRKLAAERGLEWREQVDFGGDYARTLNLWRGAFDVAAEQGALPGGFDQQFVRLWRYYLMYCEGGFLGGGINVSQVTLVKRP